MKNYIGNILEKVKKPEEKSVIICNLVGCNERLESELFTRIKKELTEIYECYKEKLDSCSNKCLGDIQLCSCLDKKGYIIANIFCLDVKFAEVSVNYKLLFNALKQLLSMENTVLRIPDRFDGMTEYLLDNDELLVNSDNVEVWCERRMTVLHNDILSEEEYLFLVTNKHYSLKNEDRLNEMRDILELESLDDLWDYRLDEIDEVKEMEHQVVLVKTKTVYDNSKPMTEYRWFEVPCETPEEVDEMLKKIV